MSLTIAMSGEVLRHSMTETEVVTIVPVIVGPRIAAVATMIVWMMAV